MYVADPTTDISWCEVGGMAISALTGLSINTVLVPCCVFDTTLCAVWTATTGGVHPEAGNAIFVVEPNAPADFEVVVEASVVGSDSATTLSDAMYWVSISWVRADVTVVIGLAGCVAVSRIDPPECPDKVKHGYEGVLSYDFRVAVRSAVFESPLGCCTNSETEM